MRTEFKKAVTTLLQDCYNYYAKSKNRTWLRNELRRHINDAFPMFNQQEKFQIYQSAWTTAMIYARTRSRVKENVNVGTGKSTDTVTVQNVPNIGSEEFSCGLVQTVGRLERRLSSHEKKAEIMDMLRESRAHGHGHGYPIVFYMCSKHSKPANDHKDYQGKIYVDRFWRAKCESNGMPEWLVKSVEKYIRDNNILTVQYITGPPVWLCTRPYCKHYFIPIHTLDILTQRIEPPKTYGKPTKRGATYDYIKKHLKAV